MLATFGLSLPAPKKPRPKPVSAKELQEKREELDKKCLIAKTNLDHLAGFLKPAATHKYTAIADLLVAVDKPVANYYENVGCVTTVDLNISNCATAALKDNNDSRLNLYAALTAAQRKKSKYNDDLIAAQQSAAAFINIEKTLRAKLTIAGCDLIEKTVKDALNVLDANLLKNSVDKFNVDDPNTATALAAFMSKWTENSSKYDAAIKAAGGLQTELAKRFQDGQFWPLTTDSKIAELQKVIADKSKPSDQATQIVDRFLSIERDASILRFQALEIALEISGISLSTVDQIQGKLTAYVVLPPPEQAPWKTSVSLPLEVINPIISSLKKDIKDCNSALAQIAQSHSTSN